jgi:hypothetical protein
VTLLLPLLLTAAALLALSAIAKLRDGAPAAAALADVGLPHARALVRAGAAAELAAAALVVVRPTAGAGAAAVLFGAFATLVALQLRAGSRRSCGCLGSASTPASRAHVAVDLAFAALCCIAVVAPPTPLDALHHPVSGAVVALGAAVAAWAAAAAFELLPAAFTAYRSPTA